MVLFLCYLVLLTYVMFFSDDFGRSGHEAYAYNLRLFHEIRRFYRYRHQLGMTAFLMNTVGNVVCFMPFGFFLPLLLRIAERWYGTLFLSFLMSLFIETVQLLLRVGSFDVDDMFLNTVGGCLGYIVCQIAQVWLRWRRTGRL